MLWEIKHSTTHVFATIKRRGINTGTDTHISPNYITLVRHLIRLMFLRLLRLKESRVGMYLNEWNTAGKVESEGRASG